MCGRFALTSEWQKVEELFQLKQKLEVRPRYNIAPSRRCAPKGGAQG